MSIDDDDDDDDEKEKEKCESESRRIGKNTPVARFKVVIPKAYEAYIHVHIHKCVCACERVCVFAN